MNFLENLEERLNNPFYTYENYVRHVGTLHAIPEEKLNLKELQEQPISEWPTREEEDIEYEDDEDARAMALRFARAVEKAPRDPSIPGRGLQSDEPADIEDPFIKKIRRIMGTPGDMGEKIPKSKPELKPELKPEFKSELDPELERARPAKVPGSWRIRALRHRRDLGR